MLYAKFLGKNGRDYELEHAKSIFTIGYSYPVKAIEIGGFSSRVYFDNYERGYNTVMFEFHDENDIKVNIYSEGCGYFEY